MRELTAPRMREWESGAAAHSIGCQFSGSPFRWKKYTLVYFFVAFLGSAVSWEAFRSQMLYSSEEKVKRFKVDTSVQN